MASVVLVCPRVQRGIQGLREAWRDLVVHAARGGRGGGCDEEEKEAERYKLARACFGALTAPTLR